MMIKRVGHQQNQGDKDDLFRPAIKFPAKKSDNKEIEKKHRDECGGGDKKTRPGNACQEGGNFNGDIRQEARKIKNKPSNKRGKGN